MANFSRVAHHLFAVGTAITVLAAPSVLLMPAATADPVAVTADNCPVRATTPPAISASEVPKPGDPPPAPLPVPATPIGGAALGGCGVVVAPDTPPLPDDISAEAWLVADIDTGDVIAAKDPHGRHRPASVIKALTAMAAINELPLNRHVHGTEHDSVIEGTKVGVGPGGIYTVRELLHGLMMYSGNDAAHALAVQLGGYDAGMQKLNALADELGARDTRAATPSGLDGPGMSTSAYDIGLLYRYAWQNPTFTEIVATRNFDFPGRDGNPYPIVNDNQLLTNYPGALGGKTGFTDDAGQTFVGAADRDGRRLVAVLLRGTRQPIPPWQQAAHLLDYGFATPPGTKVGTLIDPDPSLSSNKTNASRDADTTAAPVLLPADAMPVRIGVAVIGSVIVFGLIMASRSLNRLGRA